MEKNLTSDPVQINANSNGIGNLNIKSVLLAVASLLAIGIFHPIVIKCEYYFTEKIWPLFLIIGIILLGMAVNMNGIVADILAIIGASSFWTILELKKQTIRVQKGWFPKNPRKHPMK